MIDLTPLEVRQKKGDFRRSFRGYDAELVNDFLELVADRMEELVKQNMDLQDAVGSLREELGEYRKKEQSLSEALMTAQRLREDARSHAEKEGELLVREARLAAESARQEATKSLAREEETLRQVRARRGQLVESFRRMLERELGELAVIEETLELEAEKAAAGAASGAAERTTARAQTEAEPQPPLDTDTLAGPDPEPDVPAAAESEPPAPIERASPEPKRPSPETERPSPESEPEGGLLDIESFESDERPASPRRSPEPRAKSDTAADDEDDLQEDWLKSLVEE